MHTVIDPSEEIGNTTAVLTIPRTISTAVLFYGEGEAGADRTTEPLTIHGITQTQAKTTTRNIDALAIDYACLRKGMYI